MRGSLTRYLLQGVCLVLPVVLTQSCASPQAVVVFAGNAEKTIAGSADLFADIHGSCVRRHQAAAPVSANFLPAALREANTGTPSDIAPCAKFTEQGEALTKASKVLSAYFRSMQQIASFDTTTVSGPSEKGTSGIGMASGLNSTQVDSVSKLTNLLTEAFTERYRQHHLAKMLTEADPAIGSITQAFEDIVGRDYEGLLREEQQTLPTQYQAVADTKMPAAILLLNRAYASDLNELEERKAAAQAYVEAMRQIREGHHALAKNVKNLKGKELTAAIEVYSDKLAALVPTLEKRL